MGFGSANDWNEFAMEAATVFIVDDDEDVRNSISILARSVNLDVELFASGQEFLNNYQNDRPGCLVLDARMPGMSGLELQQKLNEQVRRIPTIMLTAHAEVSMATQVLRAGAVDFMQKPFSPQILLERIHEAIQLDADTRRADEGRTAIAKLVTSLSPREQEVMELLAVGRSTKEIAAQLQISIKTVDNHRANVLEKMCVGNTAQLANLLARSA
ncbi:MAG: response regulator transcription factor [Planctomycetia bacterium]|nr:response regulator transcription factor [Planctomycetia bacterium]